MGFIVWVARVVVMDVAVRRWNSFGSLAVVVII